MRTGTQNIQGDLYYGGWQLVYENLLTSAATSVTISGLDGDNDEEYRLVCRFVHNANSGNYQIRFNNDAGSNYGYQRLTGRDTTASATRAGYSAIPFDLLGDTYLGHLYFVDALIYAKSGYVRTVLSKSVVDIDGTTIEELNSIGSVWNNTADNVTSLVIFANQTNGLGVGTHILLFKRMKTGIDATTGRQYGDINCIGKLSAGVMQKIYETTLTEAVSSVTISGLDGNTDIVYELIMRNVTITESLPELFINNDQAGNIGEQRLEGVNTTVTAVRRATDGAVFSKSAFTGSYSLFANALIYAKSGYVRTGIINSTAGISGTTVSEAFLNGFSWNNTADNITSLVISNYTGGMGIGTHIELWKLSKKT